MEDLGTAQKKKKPNWSPTEVDLLVRGVEDFFGTIKGRFSSKLSKSDKNKAWQTITDRVNSVSAVHRTSTEVRKKWTDISSLSKKKEAQRRAERKKTGGGPSVIEQPTPVEEKVVSLLADEAIEGVPGGLDTFDIPAYLGENAGTPIDVVDLLVAPMENDLQTYSGRDVVPQIDLGIRVVEKDTSGYFATSSGGDVDSVTCQLVGNITEAGPSKKSKDTCIDLMSAITPVVDFEDRRLALDRERLALERERFIFEKEKWAAFLDIQRARLTLEERLIQLKEKKISGS